MLIVIYFVFVDKDLNTIGNSHENGKHSNKSELYNVPDILAKEVTNQTKKQLKDDQLVTVLDKWSQGSCSQFYTVCK